MLLTCREAFLLTVFAFRFYFVQFVGKARTRDLVCAVVEISPYESAGHVRKEAVQKKKKRKEPAVEVSQTRQRVSSSRESKPTWQSSAVSSKQQQQWWWWWFSWRKKIRFRSLPHRDNPAFICLYQHSPPTPEYSATTIPNQHGQ